jgi:hypothetical protein
MFHKLKSFSRSDAMIRRTYLLFILMFVPIFAMCQSEESKFDLFGGYSYLARSGVGSGWNAEAAYNFTRNIGITMDFSGNYSSTSVNISGVLPTPVNVSSNINYHFFMVGPQFAFHAGPVRPFAHVLVGASYLHASASLSSPSGGGSAGAGTVGFASAIGIGVDVKTSRRLSLRLVQVDGLLTRFGGNSQGLARISTGVVFHF